MIPTDDSTPELDLAYEVEFVTEDVEEILRIEDDGVVAYAYCWKDNEIAGFVWLYNHGPAPTLGQLRARGLPPPNFEGFAKNVIFDPITNDSEVEVVWDDENKQFRISIRGKIHAVVAAGTLPGWCVLAEKPSPSARQLVVE